MKSLQSFINEGLISDIILRLLDAGIAWIGKGLDFVGENIKAASGEIWDVYKNSLKNREDNPNENKANPFFKIKNETQLMKYITSEGLKGNTYQERVNEINKTMEFFKEYAQCDEEDDGYITMYCNLHYMNSKMTSVAENATAEEKKAAADKITEILNKGGKYRTIMKKIGVKQASIDKKNKKKQDKAV